MNRLEACWSVCFMRPNLFWCEMHFIPTLVFSNKNIYSEHWCIFSGRHGCPLDLCCVQYARAVTDYSKLARHPLKEIHFVDLNWQTVQMMQATFQSMIYDEKVPKFYDDLAHGSEASVYGKSCLSYCREGVFSSFM